MTTNVVRAYKTSKGIFWSINKANRKCNRKQILDDRDGSLIGYETPIQIYVLRSDITTAIFELKEITVTWSELANLISKELKNECAN